MESALDYWGAKALLEWQVELGATEALCEAPVNRYELAAPAPKPAPGAAPDAAAKPGAQGQPAPAKPKPVDPVAVAQNSAKAAVDLPGLQAALAGFSHCDLKRGARNLVFGAGAVGARVMVIGEAPNREDDREGQPFAGPAGALLDRMLAAIDLGRDADVYLTNVLPWRPPQGRDPSGDEIAMMVPFLRRHVELVQPEILILMGNTSCQAVLGKRGISRLRGQWGQVWDRPALPMQPPDALLGEPALKSRAWADLLSLKARLGG